MAVIPARLTSARILEHLGLLADPEDFTAIRGPPDAFEPLDDGWGDVANDDGVDNPQFDPATQPDSSTTTAERAQAAVQRTGLSAVREFRHFSA